jgi:hypothetical protein
VATLISAALSDNYHAFFRLYRDTSATSSLVQKAALALHTTQRRVGLRAMLAAYHPTLPLPLLIDELGFGSERECRAYLAECDGLVFDDGGAALLTKQSRGFTFKD